MSLDLHGDHRGTLVVLTGRSPDRFDLKALRLDDRGKFADPEIRLTSLHKQVFADLNGDGLRDWVAQWDRGVQIWWNTGLELRRSETPLWPSVEDTQGEWQVADIDGDGDDELLVMKGGSKPELVVFRYAPERVVGGILAASATMRVIEGIAPGQLGDFNGDGFLDVASSAGGKLLVHKQIAGPHDLLQSVWDEHSDSPRERIQYQAGDWSQPRTRCRYPQRCIRQGFQVVRRHSRTDAGTLCLWNNNEAVRESDERLTSEDLATLVIDALLRANVVKAEEVERAIKIATEEIDARKALGDY